VSGTGSIVSSGSWRAGRRCCLFISYCTVQTVVVLLISFDTINNRWPFGLDDAGTNVSPSGPRGYRSAKPAARASPVGSREGVGPE
jgi:hypothetical protein